jgi:RNA polymerase sigma-70 factor, ECF subfamily
MSEKEFLLLVNQHRGILYKVIRLYINHPDDEQDLFQEILFQAWKSVGNFKGHSKFSTWLYRVSLNTVLTFKRRPKLVMAVDDLTAHDTPAVDANADHADLLYQAMRSLSEIDRLILTMHLDGFDNDEIAGVTGLTKNNVAVRLHRAKENVITKMKNDA